MEELNDHDVDVDQTLAEAEALEEDAEEPAPPLPATRRYRPPATEFEILVEDVERRVTNKYLAVNIAARRARELNELELPFGDHARSARKPTTQALVELVEGRLDFEVIGVRPALGDTDADLEADAEEDVAAIFEEFEESADLDIDIGGDDYDDGDDT
ncbi:DNA-directed RNA polymerase subunit omega [Candidatus Poribacteria bacterium]|nr:DNA-directed RNA polymerase subunit omega [Candidatus Poribacteria bacterium]